MRLETPAGLITLLALGCAGASTHERQVGEPAGAQAPLEWAVEFRPVTPPATETAGVHEHAYIERQIEASGLGRPFVISTGRGRREDDGSRLVEYQLAPRDAEWSTSLQHVVDLLVHLERGTARPLWVSRLDLGALDAGGWSSYIEIASYGDARRDEGPSAVDLLEHVLGLLAGAHDRLDGLQLRELAIDLAGRSSSLCLAGSIGTAADYEDLLAVLAGSPRLDAGTTGPLRPEGEHYEFAEVRLAIVAGAVVGG